MLSVERFCCLKLEVGVLFIGYLNCLASIILIFLIVFNYGDEFLKLVGSLFAAVIYFLSSYFLLTGVKSRNHIYVSPFRAIAFFAFLGLTFAIVLTIVKLKDDDNREVGYHHLILEILAVIVVTYVFICIHSIHKRFKSEKFGNRAFVLSY
ncbi:hypothetical protein ACKWTF_012733 [Chironomus riparius]